MIFTRLIDLVSDDHAVTETLYYLSKAMNAGKMDIKVFMKLTRTLAVEQFMMRAWVLKIRKRIGLAT